jgi:hypothetical protein
VEGVVDKVSEECLERPQNRNYDFGKVKPIDKMEKI